jgi:hypothetical protein
VFGRSALDSAWLSRARAGVGKATTLTLPRAKKNKKLSAKKPDEASPFVKYA